MIQNLGRVQVTCDQTWYLYKLLSLQLWIVIKIDCPKDNTPTQPFRIDSDTLVYSLYFLTHGTLLEYPLLVLITHT